MSMPSWTSPRASDRTLPISRVIARARRSLCSAMRWANANMISPRFGAGVRCHIGRAAHGRADGHRDVGRRALLEAPDDVALRPRGCGSRRSGRSWNRVHSPAMKWRNVGTSVGASRWAAWWRSRSWRECRCRVRRARRPSRPNRRRPGTGSRGRSGPRGARARGAASRRSARRSRRSGGRARSRRR